MARDTNFEYKRLDGRVEGDPHFSGPYGLKYDFNGVPGKSYCLLTDLHFQVNILLDGYYDKRTEGAYAFEEGQMSRCWNRETGIIWLANGKEHRLQIVPRVGPQVERGEGFIQTFRLDGRAIPRLEVAQAHRAEGGLCILFTGIARKGPKEVDEYEVQIGGQLALTVSAHVANEQLRTPEDSWNHINIGIAGAKVSPHLHGLMGQVFRDNHFERVHEFAKKGAELNAPVVADGTSGKGLLDGDPEDYVTDGVLSTNCRYSVFGEKQGCEQEYYCEEEDGEDED